MRARLALFISFLMLLSPRVLGQEAGLDAGADVIVLPEIVVESRKRDEDPKDVPFGVSVITGLPCSNVTRSASISAFNAKAEPVSRWHQVQWQQWTNRGADSSL